MKLTEKEIKKYLINRVEDNNDITNIKYNPKSDIFKYTVNGVEKSRLIDQVIGWVNETERTTVYIDNKKCTLADWWLDNNDTKFDPRYSKNIGIKKETEKAILLDVPELTEDDKKEIPLHEALLDNYGKGLWIPKKAINYEEE